MLRGAFAEHGGVEIDNQGDSFFVVFAGAMEAVRCAANAQRRLAREPWPGKAPVRVRMAVHTGPAVVDAGRYVGLDVHIGARMGAAAHGSQVLISEATSALVRGRLPVGLDLRGVGEHRLRDLPHPQRLWQLVIEGAPNELAPPRTLEPLNTLPKQLVSFVDRVEETAELRRLLRSTRLVTVTGPGGTGKTRLALQVAAGLFEEFPNGVHFVRLASVEDPDLVGSAIAAALGLDISDSRSPDERVLDHLADKRLLLVLDNFEHVQRASSYVDELLAAADDIVLLITSRSPLHVYGEREFLLQPLATPPARSNLADIGESDAVTLFVERARAISPSFALTPDNAADVVELVRRLDGLPLAIELAAARVKVLPPRALLRRLTDRFDVLAQHGGTRPTRHETLGAAIAWSYDLLDARLQRTFVRFSVFAGPVALERAEQVCMDDDHHDVVDDLAVLVDNSLLVASERTGETAFAMLRTVRSFARDRLAALGHEHATLGRHASAMLSLAEDVASTLTGANAREQLDKLDAEHDDLREALRYAIAERNVATAMPLLAALWRFWQMRGHLSEGRRMADQVLALPGTRDEVHLCIHALEAAGGIAYWQGDLTSARRLYTEAVDLSRCHGSQQELANSLYNLSFADSVTNTDQTSARRWAEESLALSQDLQDHAGMARALFALGNAAYFQDDVTAARDALAKCLALAPDSNSDFLERWASYELGMVEQQLGRPRQAEELYRCACRGFSAAGDFGGTVMTLNALADVAMLRHDVARAARLAAAADRLETSSGARFASFVLEKERRGSLTHLQQLAPRDWAAGEEMNLDAAVILALQAQGRETKAPDLVVEAAGPGTER